MAFAALLIGFARAIYVVLDEGQIVDTIVHGLFTPIAELPVTVSALAMMAAHTVIHVPVPSTSGQAVLTLPLLVPLSDLIGLSRQVTVLAYQYGAGLCELLTPTNGALMAMLAAAGVRYEDWLRFAVPLFGLLLALAAVAIGRGGRRRRRLRPAAGPTSPASSSSSGIWATPTWRPALLAVLESDEGGNAPDAEAGQERGVGVGVQFQHQHLARCVAWRSHPAPAPSSCRVRTSRHRKSTSTGTLDAVDHRCRSRCRSPSEAGRAGSAVRTCRTWAAASRARSTRLAVPQNRTVYDHRPAGLRCIRHRVSHLLASAD